MDSQYLNLAERKDATPDNRCGRDETADQGNSNFTNERWEYHRTSEGPIELEHATPKSQGILEVEGFVEGAQGPSSSVQQNTTKETYDTLANPSRQHYQALLDIPEYKELAVHSQQALIESDLEATSPRNPGDIGVGSFNSNSKQQLIDDKHGGSTDSCYKSLELQDQQLDTESRIGEDTSDKAKTSTTAHPILLATENIHNTQLDFDSVLPGLQSTDSSELSDLDSPVHADYCLKGDPNFNEGTLTTSIMIDPDPTVQESDKANQEAYALTYSLQASKHIDLSSTDTAQSHASSPADFVNNEVLSMNDSINASPSRISGQPDYLKEITPIYRIITNVRLECSEPQSTAILYENSLSAQSHQMYNPTRTDPDTYVGTSPQNYEAVDPPSYDLTASSPPTSPHIKIEQNFDDYERTIPSPIPTQTAQENFLSVREFVGEAGNIHLEGFPQEQESSTSRPNTRAVSRSLYSSTTRKFERSGTHDEAAVTNGTSHADNTSDSETAKNRSNRLKRKNEDCDEDYKSEMKTTQATKRGCKGENSATSSEKPNQRGRQGTAKNGKTIGPIRARRTPAKKNPSKSSFLNIEDIANTTPIVQIPGLRNSADAPTKRKRQQQEPAVYQEVETSAVAMTEIGRKQTSMNVNDNRFQSDVRDHPFSAHENTRKAEVKPTQPRNYQNVSENGRQRFMRRTEDSIGGTGQEYCASSGKPIFNIASDEDRRTSPEDFSSKNAKIVKKSISNLSQAASRKSMVDLTTEYVPKKMDSSTFGFPRVKNAEVYIALCPSETEREGYYSYCLPSNFLTIRSPWFEEKLRGEVVEPDGDRAAQLTQETGVIARFELHPNSDGDFELIRVPLISKVEDVSKVSDKITLSSVSKSRCHLTHPEIRSPAGRTKAKRGTERALAEKPDEIQMLALSSKKKEAEKTSKRHVSPLERDVIHDTAEQYPPDLLEAWNNMLLTFYAKAPEINRTNVHRAAKQAELLISLAEIYGCEISVRPHLIAALTNFGKALYKEVIQDPPRWILLSFRLQLAHIFREAFTHIVGSAYLVKNGSRLLHQSCWAFQVLDQADLDPELRWLLQTKINDLYHRKSVIDKELFTNNIFVNEVEKSLFTKEGSTLVNWVAVAAWREWLAEALSAANITRNLGNGIDATMYRLIGKGGDAYLSVSDLQSRFARLTDLKVSQGDGLIQLENALGILKMNAQEIVKQLSGNISMLQPEEEGFCHFTCTNVSNEELPWP